jgi:hypothetical protein
MVEGRRVAHLSFTDYYRLLDLQPGAPDEEVRKSLRAKILEFHPDRNPDDPNANDKLREVLQAKEMLSDSAKRRTYDSVYFAKTLQRWSGPKRTQHSQPTYQNPQQEPERQKTQYENYVNSAREKSSRDANLDIDHLINEINAILSVYGKNPAHWGHHVRHEVNRVQYGMIGTVLGGLGGFALGMITGSGLGVIVLILMGGIAGWFLGTYSGELIAIIFMCLRILLAGYLVTLVASLITEGDSFSGLLRTTMVMTSAAIAGAAVFGLFRIGVNAVSERLRIFLGYSVVRQAAVGAWGGALITFILVLGSGALDDIGLKAVYWWFGLFSLYLVIDTQAFGRPWIIAP